MRVRYIGRYLTIILCIILVGQISIPFLLGPISASPAIDQVNGAPYVIDVYPVASAITIDGNLSEPAWSDPNTAVVTTTNTSYGWNITMYVFHNTTHLFIGVQNLIDTSSNPQDYCELAFDVDHDSIVPPEATDMLLKSENTGITEEYDISYGDGAVWVKDSDETNTPNPWPAGFLVNATIQANATYEFQIPISAVWGIPSPADGNISGFIAHAFGQADGQHVWWPDNSDDQNNPNPEYCDNASTYGDLVFRSIAPISNPLHHIELAPRKTAPTSDYVNVGGTFSGYTAIGWNDAAETEKNSTWAPVWGMSDSIGSLINSAGNWNTGYTIDYLAGASLGFDNVTIGDATFPGVTNLSCIQIIPNQLDHINITAWNQFPVNEMVAGGGTTSTYTAIGWNDVAETEKNLTWTAAWSTTDGLETILESGGEAISGWTCTYTAGVTTGYDNLTVTDVPSAKSNQSCIFVNASVGPPPPLDHIQLTPMFILPTPNTVNAGQIIAGYTAIGWNDAGQTDKNQTWTVVWGMTDSMGTFVNSGGDWNAGYTIDYLAGTTPGYDNLTVEDSMMSGISEITAILIVPDTPNKMQYVSGNGQHKLPGNILDDAFVMRVLDQFDNPVPDVDIECGLEAPAGAIGQSLSATTIQTNESGMAGTTLTLGDILGNYYVNATNATLALAGEPVVFFGEARPPPIHIALVSGNWQNSTAGTMLSQPLVVNVTYGDGTLVGPGIPVWFNVTTGTGSLVNASTVTDIGGTARTDLTLGPNAGLLMIEADVSSTGISSVLFYEIATLPDMFIALASNATNIKTDQTFSYLISFDNAGTESARDVWLNMTMPDGLYYVSDDAGVVSDVSGDLYSWHFVDLATGPHSFNLILGIIEGVANRTVINNYFTLDHTDQNDISYPTLTSNSIQVTVYEELVDNIPPVIDGVPDLIIHYDWDYRLDLSPYIEDLDDLPVDLSLLFSDSIHARVDPNNNLAMILNYSIDYLGTSQPLNITVTDGYGSDWDLITVKITEDFPPEIIAKIPDVVLNEDIVAYPFNISHYFFDRDGDSLIYTYGEKNVNITFLANSTVIVTPLKDWFGVERITFRAIDPSGALIEDTINITVNPINDAPVIGEIPNQSGEVGISWLIDLADYDLVDVDDLLKDLIITTDSQYVTANGLNLTFRFDKPAELEIITITISDGEDEIYVQINVGVTGDTLFDEMIPFLIPLVLFLLVLFIIIFILKRRFIVEQAFIIYKDGSLISHASNREIEGMDADIFTGMLTAIQDFVKDSFNDEDDASLKRVVFGESKIHFARDQSGNVSAALVYKGSDERIAHFGEELIKDLDAEFHEIFTDWDGNLDEVKEARRILLKHFER